MGTPKSSKQKKGSASRVLLYLNFNYVPIVLLKCLCINAKLFMRMTSDKPLGK